MVTDDKHYNNFDFLRIFAASLVLFSHQFAMLGLHEPDLFLSRSLGGIGVYIFFAISGYLISESWLRDPHIFRFIARRFLRVWPGLTVVTCLTVFIVGPVVTTLTVHDYFHSNQTFQFFKLLILKEDLMLPGVFATNPLADSVNGSLWTIAVEVKCYLYLLLLGALRILKLKWVVLAFLLFIVFFQFAILKIEVNHEPHFMREYGLYFLAGTCLNLFRSWWIDRKLLLLALVGILTVILNFAGHPMIALWVFIPATAIVIGNESTPVLRRFGRFGDLSYGVYIYAFLVQQCVVWYCGNGLTFAYGLALSAAITFVFAFLSWHLIEKPALKFKPVNNRQIKTHRSWSLKTEHLNTSK